MSEVKAVATLVCDTSHSGFDSRQTPLEDAAKWSATDLEHQGRVTPRGSIPPSSLHPVTRTADNCVVGVALLPQWMLMGRSPKVEWHRKNFLSGS